MCEGWGLIQGSPIDFAVYLSRTLGHCNFHTALFGNITRGEWPDKATRWGSHHLSATCVGACVCLCMFVRVYRRVDRDHGAAGGGHPLEGLWDRGT